MPNNQKFNPDISAAPKNCGLLLRYLGFPYPLIGVLRDDFDGGVALVLPSFEQYTLITPPKSWEFLGWSQAWEDEELG